MNAIRLSYLGLAMVLGATGASAFEGVCRFTVECFEDQACTPTDLELTVAPGAAARTVNLTTLGGSRQAELTQLGWKAQVMIHRGAGGVQVLTVTEEGAARLTRHTARIGRVVSLLGRCQEE